MRTASQGELSSLGVSWREQSCRNVELRAVPRPGHRPRYSGIGGRGDVRDRIVAHPQIEARLSPDAGNDCGEGSVMADTTDRVFRNRARENSADEWRQTRRLGRFGRAVGDVDQLVSQNAHAPSHAPGSMIRPLPLIAFKTLCSIFAETRSVSIVIPLACKPWRRLPLTTIGVSPSASRPAPDGCHFESRLQCSRPDYRQCEPRLYRQRCRRLSGA